MSAESSNGVKAIPNVRPIQPYHDPRVQLRQAYLNGNLYGYLFSQRLPGTKNHGTIILVHGFADISHTWRYQIPYLVSLGLDVIAVDCLGYGRSECAPIASAESYNWERCCDDLVALCNSFDLESAIFCGHGTGAQICYRLALHRPKLVRAIISIAAWFEPPGLDIRPAIESNEQERSLFDRGVLDENVKSREELKRFLLAVFSEKLFDYALALASDSEDIGDVDSSAVVKKLLDVETLNFYVNEFKRSGVSGALQHQRFATTNRNYKNDNFSEDSERRRKAILLLNTTKDTAIASKEAEHRDFEMPNLTFQSIEASSRWPHLENPENVNSFLGEWLDAKVFNKKAVSATPSEQQFQSGMDAWFAKFQRTI